MGGQALPQLDQILVARHDEVHVVAPCGGERVACAFAQRSCGRCGYGRLTEIVPQRDNVVVFRRSDVQPIHGGSSH